MGGSLPKKNQKIEQLGLDLLQSIDVLHLFVILCIGSLKNILPNFGTYNICYTNRITPNLVKYNIFAERRGQNRIILLDSNHPDILSRFH